MVDSIRWVHLFHSSDPPERLSATVPRMHNFDGGGHRMLARMQAGKHEANAL